MVLALLLEIPVVSGAPPDLRALTMAALSARECCDYVKPLAKNLRFLYFRPFSCISSIVALMLASFLKVRACLLDFQFVFLVLYSNSVGIGDTLDCCFRVGSLT